MVKKTERNPLILDNTQIHSHDWELNSVDASLKQEFLNELDCSEVLADLLVRRSFRSVEKAAEFLDPKLSHLHDPDLLPGLQEAVERIVQSIRENEKVVIFGDYDVDGLSSTALLYEFLSFVGKPPETYIPERLSEGYGLNVEAVKKLSRQEVDLIITVDNGSTAFEAAQAARDLQIDLVIIDHHLLDQELPVAKAVVNPWRADSRYPFKDLAGVGVTFKVVWALCQHFSRDKKVSPEFRKFMLDTLAYVALGTVADVVPLVGENRVLVRFGLMALEATTRPGLSELVRVAMARGGGLDSVAIAFRIAPLLNAAGRMGRSDQALKLLICQDPQEANALRRSLEKENEQRKEIERKIHEEARQEVLHSFDLKEERAIVLARQGWHPGVIGIVASRIVDEFYRPTLLICLEGEEGKGSARSISQVSIREALEESSHCLQGFGGHAMAAGVKIDAQRVEELRRSLNQAVSVEPKDMIPEIEVDGEYPLSLWNHEVLRDIQRLAPFGEGNREPRFGLKGAAVAGSPRYLGKTEEHLTFFVSDQRVSLRAVAFGQARLLEPVSQNKTNLKFIYQPYINTFRGANSIEMRIQKILL